MRYTCNWWEGEASVWTASPEEAAAEVAPDGETYIEVTSQESWEGEEVTVQRHLRRHNDGGWLVFSGSWRSSRWEEIKG